MAQIRKPDDIPEGPRKEFNDALHHLHLLAGHPSVRMLQSQIDQAGASRDRIHAAFADARMPTWELVKFLVTELAKLAPGRTPDESVEYFHRLWVKAKAPEAPEPTAEPMPETGQQPEPRRLDRRLLLTLVLILLGCGMGVGIGVGLTAAFGYPISYATLGAGFVLGSLLPGGRVFLIVGVLLTIPTAVFDVLIHLHPGSVFEIFGATFSALLLGMAIAWVRIHTRSRLARLGVQQVPNTRLRVGLGVFFLFGLVFTTAMRAGTGHIVESFGWTLVTGACLLGGTLLMPRS